MTTAFEHLQSQPRWVVWRNEQRNGKTTKVPYNARTRREAKSDDRTTWSTRPAAEATARVLVKRQAGGVGIVLGDLGNGYWLAGIDLDTCRREDGEFEPWAVEVINRFGSYAEISPSGTGAKIFFRCRADDLPKLRSALGDAKFGRQFKRGNGKDHPPAIELYLSHRYFTTTEHWLDWTPDRLVVVDVETLSWLLMEAGPAFAGSGKSQQSSGHDNSRSGAVFRLARNMRASGLSYEQFVAAARSNSETAAWFREKGEANGQRELRRAWQNAVPGAGSAPSEGVSLGDFLAYMPLHSYIYTPTRALWPGGSVNSRIPPIPLVNEDGSPKLDNNGKPISLTAAQWLDRFQPVEQMTWAPGMPEIIEGRLLYEGGWIERRGVRAFNQYLAPSIVPGDAGRADKWIEHVHFVYPEAVDHLFDFLAHRRQRPAEKVNHALVLGGGMGIGKDTILEPVKAAIGPWNFQDETPVRIMGRFNGFLKAVILRVNEARDLGESDRFKFYDHMKTLIAAPPDTLRVDEKFMREYQILNCCGIIITTNHKTDGIYLPAEDRRHYVAWSDRVKEDERFAGDYWSRLYAYYQNGGNEAVAAYLMQRDIRAFDPKAPPPKTAAFWAIVDLNQPAEEGELADVIDRMKEPLAFTLRALQNEADASLQEWLADRKSRRAIPHRLESCGYAPVRNPDAKDGFWKHGGRRQVIYAKISLSLREQIAAARDMVAQSGNGR